jgi:hypothetical protein
MHVGCELTFLPRSPVVSFALVTVCTRAFLFPIGIQLIPMNHEQRIPMKKLLIRFGYAIAVAALLTIFAQMLAVGLYVFVLVAVVCTVAYFHLRTNE